MSAPAGSGASGWECRDNSFGLPEVRELCPGLLDDDAEYVFTNGHCHSFAEAIGRLASIAELFFAFDLCDEGEREEALGHLLVRIHGRYLDARGWLDDLLDAEGGNRAFEREWDRVIAIGPQGWLEHSKGWLEPRVDDALPFAEALLMRLQVPIDGRPRRGPRGAALQSGEPGGARGCRRGLAPQSPTKPPAASRFPSGPDHQGGAP